MIDEDDSNTIIEDFDFDECDQDLTNEDFDSE